MRTIMLGIIFAALVMVNGCTAIAAESVAGTSDETPQWVARAKIALAEAYWGEGEYIVAVGSATRMLDISHQQKAATYRAKANVLRALGITEALLVNTEIVSIWKDPTNGTIYTLVRIHRDSVFPVE